MAYYRPLTNKTTATTCTRTITIAAVIPRNCRTGYDPVITVGKYRITPTSCRLDRDTANPLDS